MSAADLDLTTIFAGLPWQVALLEHRLQAAGIPTFVLDQAVWTLSPFVTVGDLLHLCLQVPAAQVEAVRALVCEFQAEEHSAPGAAPP